MIESVEMIIRQPGHPERVVRLQEGVTRIGRAEDNDVVLSDVGVSRRHSRVVVSKEQVRVEDLGSGNGSYYRGFRIQNQQIEDGDEIIIDPFVLQFRVKGQSKRAAGEQTAPGGGMPARLDVVAGAGLSKQSYPIGPRGLTIGRSETRDVVIPDPAASRHHCSILARDNAWVLRDMGSANGVFVNGVRVRESLLNDGDRVRIGNTELRFVVNDPTQADSTTQRVPAEPWAEADNAWTEHELSLPNPENSATPQVRPRRSSSTMRIVGAGIGIVVFMLVALVGLIVVGVGVYFAWPYLGASSATASVAKVAEPPAWRLELPGGLPATDVKSLQEEGMKALKSGDNRTALQDFYRVLQGDPGKPSAERLAFAAGEYLVLEAMSKEVSASAAERQKREARRDQLIADANGRGSRATAARRTLEAEFRDDPVAVEQMGWRPSAKAQELGKKLAEAAEHTSAERWKEAAAAYEAVLAETTDPSMRKQARAGFKASRRELARLAGAEWRAGVVAEAKGDKAAAKAHYEKVLLADPGNPSARLRLKALGA